MTSYKVILKLERAYQVEAGSKKEAKEKVLAMGISAVGFHGIRYDKLTAADPTEVRPKVKKETKRDSTSD